ncbi:MAG: peptidyl-prolyl cis-trans isomerase [Pirellulales bacterium]
MSRTIRKFNFSRRADSFKLCMWILRTHLFMLPIAMIATPAAAQLIPEEFGPLPATPAAPTPTQSPTQPQLPQSPLTLPPSSQPPVQFPTSPLPFVPPPQQFPAQTIPNTQALNQPPNSGPYQAPYQQANPNSGPAPFPQSNSSTIPQQPAGPMNGFPGSLPVQSNTTGNPYSNASFNRDEPSAPPGSFTLPKFNAAELIGIPAEKEFEAAQLICVVGGKYIIAGDMFVFIEPILDEYRKKITPEQEKMLRTQLVRRALVSYVEVKALNQEFFREMTGNGTPQELRESEGKVLPKAKKAFYDKRVPDLVKKYEVNDLIALDQKLREKSMSLRVLETQFVENVLAGEVQRKHVPEKFEIGRDELLAYYKKNHEKYEKPGRAKFRQLTVKFKECKSREEAQARIAEMGNEILFGGKRFDAVARDKSHGPVPKADPDWVILGNLVSEPLNEAVSTLPVRRLSQVIEDDVGLHIIEVLEREEASTVSFEEAQTEIRKEIEEKKREDAGVAYRKSVMARTIIWTRWPEDIPGSRSLAPFLQGN